MPKKIKFESFKYRFLIAAQTYRQFSAGSGHPSWEDFLRALEFQYENDAINIAWKAATPGALHLPLTEPRFYLRGDNDDHIARQRQAGLLGSEDPVKLQNETYFRNVVLRVAESAGYRQSASTGSDADQRRAKERAFHDAWAGTEDAATIDVRAMNEACTAPEMRYITRQLGDIRRKRLLDVGCGLGEASVYFALGGAHVTASDLSQGMLDVTSRLAQANGVRVDCHLAAAEDLRLPQDARFDIIYAGNLLHHSDVDQTLRRMAQHLAPNGVLVTWDPIAYNPVINVYRCIATEVRTPDEHPLKWRDIQLFRRHFRTVKTRYFWLTTLIIFILMAVVERRSPNRERFWKAVIQESAKWQWLYGPLEGLDRAMLRFFPPFRLLCWNVVVIATGAIDTD